MSICFYERTKKWEEGYWHWRKAYMKLVCEMGDMTRKCDKLELELDEARKLAETYRNQYDSLAGTSIALPWEVEK